MAPVTDFELRQLKLAAIYFKSESHPLYKKNTILFYTVILCLSILWLCFTFSLWLIPVLGIIQALFWLWHSFKDRPKTIERNRQIMTSITEMINNEKIDVSSYRGVRAIQLEPYHELRLIVIELEDEQTLILHDPDYTLGGMLYFGENVKTYNMPFAREIFGQDIYSSGKPIPFQTVKSEIYADIFFSQGSDRIMVVPRSLDQILDEAIARQS